MPSFESACSCGLHCQQCCNQVSRFILHNVCMINDAGHSASNPSASSASSSSALRSSATKAIPATSIAKRRKAPTVEGAITTAVPLSNKRVLKVTFNILLSNLRLPKAFITPQQVMGAFSRSVNAELLTGLFFTIGSAQAIGHLQATCHGIRQHRHPFALSSATVLETLRSLGFLELSLRLNTILRRYHLVRLLQHRQAIEASWQHATARGVRKATWSLNQMMMQANPQVIHPSRQADALPEYTAARLESA